MELLVTCKKTGEGVMMEIDDAETVWSLKVKICETHPAILPVLSRLVLELPASGEVLRGCDDMPLAELSIEAGDEVVVDVRRASRQVPQEEKDEKQARHLYRLAVTAKKPVRLESGEVCNRAQLLEKAISLQPNNTEYMLVLCRYSSDSEQIKSLYVRVLEIDPDNGLAANNLSLLVRRGGWVPLTYNKIMISGTAFTSMELARRAVSRLPGDPAPLHNLAQEIMFPYQRVTLEDGRHLSSLDLLKEAVSLEPRMPNSYNSIQNIMNDWYPFSGPFELSDGTLLTKEETSRRHVLSGTKVVIHYTIVADSLPRYGRVRLLDDSFWSREELLEKALELDGSNAEAYALVAADLRTKELAWVKGEQMTKRGLLLKALEIDPACMAGLLHLACDLAGNERVQVPKLGCLGKQQLLRKAAWRAAGWFATPESLLRAEVRRDPRCASALMNLSLLSQTPVELQGRCLTPAELAKLAISLDPVLRRQQNHLAPLPQFPFLLLAVLATCAVVVLGSFYF